MIVQPKYTAQSAARYPSNIDETAASIFRALHRMRVALWFDAGAPTSLLLSIAWSGSVYVAVGVAAGDAYIVTSPDGVTWTERANPKNFNLNKVTWGNGIFVAVGNPDGADAYLITSPDGVTWTERSNAKNIRLNDVVWSGSLFCAVGHADGSDAYVLTSPDGIIWTERSNPKNLNLLAVEWGAGLFVAGGAIDGDGYLITSPDGINWTERVTPVNSQIEGIAWNGNLFVAVGGSFIHSSPDGINWTRRSSISVSNLGAIFDGIMWWVFGGVAQFALISFDGVAWFPITPPVDQSAGAVPVRDAVYDGKRFLIVGGNSGADAFIRESASLV